MGMKLNMAKLLVLGIVIAGISIALEQFLQPGSGGSLLLSTTIWLAIAEGCIALMAAAEIAHAKWHKPIVERMLSAHPMLLVVLFMFVIQYTQLDIYPWADGHGVWLTKNMFMGRHIVLILLVFMVARKFAADTLRELDSRRFWAVIYMLSFALHQSMVGFEWIMSLEKPWFSQ